jgi:hypothetical protein
MRKLLSLSAIALLGALGACEPANDVVVTNDNNVVLNDLQANYASTNDGEVPANDSGGLMPAPADNAAGATGNTTAP